MLEKLTREDAIPLRLSALYEQYGYVKFRMSKFESYDLYRENKNFLKSRSIITFTGANGRLMALKPDITLSMIKNTRADTVSGKLYYLENVFRLNQSGNEYLEIRQMGLEYIGGDTGYPEAEVVSLALATLREISEDYILNISHMSFLAAFASELSLTTEATAALFDAFRGKSLSTVAALARDWGVDSECADALVALSSLSGASEDVLPKLRTLVRNDEMANAVDELCALVDTLGDDARHVKLDLSVINDLDYYNGIVFQGFVRGIPRTVLSGGRYDNMMKRFSKTQPALGFALYLGELDRALHVARDYDVDILLLYGDAPQKTVAATVRRLMSDGFSVRAERSDESATHAKQTMRLMSDGTLEVTLNA